MRGGTLRGRMGGDLGASDLRKFAQERFTEAGAHDGEYSEQARFKLGLRKRLVGG